MKNSALFVAGLLVGALLVGIAVAQTAGVRGVNRNADGSVRLTYLQASRETFVELIPAGPGQTPGITHFGVEVGDIDATVAKLRQSRAQVGDPGMTPANARFTRLTDGDGIQIEVMEYGPNSLQRKAIDAWR